jgi:hypothetical protein
MGGQHFGPLGAPGAVTKNLALTMESVTSAYQLADIDLDKDLAQMVASSLSATTDLVPNNTDANGSND